MGRQPAPPFLYFELKEKPHSEPGLSWNSDRNRLTIIRTIDIVLDSGLDPGAENSESIRESADPHAIYEGEDFFQSEIKTGVC